MVLVSCHVKLKYTLVGKKSTPLNLLLKGFFCGAPAKPLSSSPSSDRQLACCSPILIVVLLSRSGCKSGGRNARIKSSKCCLTSGNSRLINSCGILAAGHFCGPRPACQLGCCHRGHDDLTADAVRTRRLHTRLSTQLPFVRDDADEDGAC